MHPPIPACELFIKNASCFFMFLYFYAFLNIFYVFLAKHLAICVLFKSHVSKTVDILHKISYHREEALHILLRR